MGTPDSEYYLAIARNLANGQGFVWNNEPVLLVPPGWPVFLAGAMRISSSMAFLNLIPLAGSLLGLVLWYGVLVHITSPKRAFAIMCVVGVLFSYNRFAQHFYSECIFLPLLAAALLLAFRIRDGHVRYTSMFGLLTLCCLLVLVRWAALFYWPILATACLSSQPWRQQKTALLAVALSGLVIGGTLLATRHELTQYALAHVKSKTSAAATSTKSLTKVKKKNNETAIKNSFPSQQATKDGETGVTLDYSLKTNRSKQPVAVAVNSLPAPTVPTGSAADGRLGSASSSSNLEQHSQRTVDALRRAKEKWFGRILHAGHWQTTLYWPATKIARSSDSLGANVLNMIGWGMWLLLALGLRINLLAGQRMAWGVLAFSAGMILFSGVVERYLSPALPLLLWGTFAGIDSLRDPLKHWSSRWVGSVALYGAIGSILICNAMFLIVSIVLLHTGNFSEHWCGGDHRSIVNIAQLLDEQQGTIAVSSYAVNLGAEQSSGATARLLHWLTNSKLKQAPYIKSKASPDASLAKWAKSQGVRYYVYRPPINPWRLWHFRLPWLQEVLTAQPIGEPNPSYQLYELKEGKWREVSVPRIAREITHAPGL